MVDVMDVITLDDVSDDESSRTSQSSSITNGITNTFTSSATIKITNERPLDLSQFLNFSATPAPEIHPSSSVAPKVHAPFMSRPAFVPRVPEPKRVIVANRIRDTSAAANVAVIKTALNAAMNSILTDGNRKRSMEAAMTPKLPQVSAAMDKRPRLSVPSNKKDIHGSQTYVVSEPHHGFTAQDGDEFSGQFRCTSLNCNKVLSNNVSFMYHLWAHVGFFKRRDYSTEYDEMTDEKFTRMCTVCLTVFETAFEKTRHYLEVHRGTFLVSRLCHVCEIADHDGKHAHEVKHRTTELPYECRKCKFRASSRMALIDHFAKIHIGTTLLMCPFCPYSTQISQSEKLKPIVLAKNYVNHVCHHGEIIAQKCSCCSYKFIDEERFGKHIACHASESHKYPIQHKSFKNLKEESLKTKPRHEQLTLLKCLECGLRFPKAEDHFDKERTCDKCNFQSKCVRAVWKHRYLSDCDPENRERFELAVVQDDDFVPPKCSSKIKKSLTVMKSKDFIQNFRLFRDFNYDRKEVPRQKVEPKTGLDIVKERRDKLKAMTTARRTSEIPIETLDAIAENIFTEYKEDKETIDFIKSIRVPPTPLFEEFLAEKKRKEAEETDEDKDTSTPMEM